MSLLWIIIAAAALGLAVFACGVALLAPRVQAAVRLRAALGLTAPRPAVSASAARVTSRMERMLARAARVLPASPKEAALTRQLLVQAGYREPQHNRMYSGLRAILVFAPLLLVLAAGWERHLPLLLAALPAVGWLLPRMLLRRLARRRAQRIALSLPDVLDLLVVCIEAGLGLEQAMQRVARELRPVHPCLCGELELVALESRAGVARIDALRHLTQR
ncbi:MAG: hypothetical protein ACRD1F_00835, partial [Terriglobales bacterium]